MEVDTKQTVKYWCEYTDWSNDTSYWKAHCERPNWLCISQADRVIFFDEKKSEYKVVKCRKSSIDSTFTSLISHDEMQWIILQAKQN